MEISIFLFWIIGSIVAAAIAIEKGRSGFGFFLIAVILSPLFGIICAFAAGKNTDYLEQQQINNGSMRRCGSCDEIVRVEAIKCRHCGSELAEIANDHGEGWGYWLGSLFRAR